MNSSEKRRILIIEDNLDILELYRLYFSQKDFEVYTSENGLSGLVDLLDKKPDIILLDIMMPQMNGFEVLESIKSQSSIDTPIIVCSNLSQDSDKEKALTMGAKLYITKSDFEIPEIVEKTIKVLEDSTRGL